MDNIYANRNQIGATIHSQPFGEQGLLVQALRLVDRTMCAISFVFPFIQLCSYLFGPILQCAYAGDIELSQGNSVVVVAFCAVARFAGAISEGAVIAVDGLLQLEALEIVNGFTTVTS
jgi:hypothetical protein